jgi:glutathione S-transferase
MPTTMRLYDYAASGNCYRVRLLLALLDLPYERVAIDIFAGHTLTDEFARLNPARETPVLELESGEVIVQSNAILWYLAEGTPFLPDGMLERARVLQWLLFEQEWIARGIGAARFMVLTGRSPERVGARVALGTGGLELLEAHLADREFVVGERASIADVSLYAYAHVAPDAGLELGAFSAVQRWIAHIEALPGFLNDYAPYPDNARPGVSRSLYD